jgi:hypothetical protein
MKKFILITVASFLLYSCQNEQTSIDNNLESSALVQRKCASHDVLQEQLKENPLLAIKMNEIEAFTQKAFLTKKLVNGKIVIPVVVNLLYRTAAENISDAQIQTQIDVLNKDFTATNPDFANTPTEFASVAANVDITFELVTINRKTTTKTSWGTRDTMKKTSRGGLNPTSPTTNLNIWICTIGGGILGYAQFPGGSSATDGVVIDSKYIGLSAASSYPYNLGRTASHEVGHWMNLRHIWGDASCGNDFVADTPVAKEANYGVPAYPHVSACLPTHNEMTMNYMDYTDDRGMFMFTNGQKSRMQALFVTGGARAGFGI